LEQLFVEAHQPGHPTGGTGPLVGLHLGQAPHRLPHGHGHGQLLAQFLTAKGDGPRGDNQHGAPALLQLGNLQTKSFIAIKKVEYVKLILKMNIRN
jgi:hypothetical protein